MGFGLISKLESIFIELLVRIVMPKNAGNQTFNA
jgi:hypothetical protein